MARHKLRMKEIIITQLIPLVSIVDDVFSLHCSSLYFSFDSASFTGVDFLCCKLLSASCSENHIAVEEIYRRCLSIEALPLSFSILLPLPLRDFFFQLSLSLRSLVMLKINLYQATLHDS